MMRHPVPNVFIVFVLLASMTPLFRGADAATYDWNVDSGEFTSAGNWTPVGGPPDAIDDTARFNRATVGTVTFAQPMTNFMVSVMQGNATLDLQGRLYNVIANGSSAHAYNAGLMASAGARLLVTNGRVRSGATKPVGAVTVSGAGGYIEGGAVIANSGSIIVTNGATFQATSLEVMYPALNVTVTGNGSLWTNTGALNLFYGRFRLNVLAGGRFLIGNNLATHYGYGGTNSRISVSGPGSALHQVANSLFFLGTCMDVSDGASVRGYQMMVNEHVTAPNAARLTINAASMTNTIYLIVGADRHGSVVITNGGTMRSRFGYQIINGIDLARDATATGTVTVTGSGSRWDVDHNLSVGGSFNYYSGAPVGYDAFLNGGMGRLTVAANGLVSGGRYVRVGSRGTVDLNGGTITTAFGVQTLRAGGRIQGSGTIGGSVTITNGAFFAPGSPVGTMTISNNLTLASTSTSSVHIVGSACGTAQVKGNLKAAGTLNVSISRPAASRFVLFSVTGNRTGEFSQTNWVGYSDMGAVRAGFEGKDYVVNLPVGSVMAIH